MTRFHCRPDVCDDSCCQLWNVLIDRSTAEAYMKSDDMDVRKIAQISIIKSEKEDIHKISLTQSGLCAFLMDDSMCLIQSRLGEQKLSRTCKTYPRVIYSDGIHYHRGLDLSCPIVSELIVGHKEPLVWQWFDPADDAGIPLSDSDHQILRVSETTLQTVFGIIETFHHHEGSMSDRINAILVTHGHLEMDLESLHGFDSINGFMALKFSSSDQFSFHSKKFTPYLMESLNVYSRLGKKASEGYKRLMKEHLTPYLMKNEFLLENVLTMDLFCHGSAMIEKMGPDAGTKLVLQRAAVKLGLLHFLMTGVSAARKSMDDALAANLIQSFMKTFNQDESYWKKATMKL